MTEDRERRTEDRAKNREQRRQKGMPRHRLRRDFAALRKNFALHPKRTPQNSNDLRNIFYRSDKKYDAKAGCGVFSKLNKFIFATRGDYESQFDNRDSGMVRQNVRVAGDGVSKIQIWFSL